ncbi:hypothetical protein [Roseibium denhamense]|uniref:hypothetical protein n=1 Tax=Roseibium denhamense TaxID=76305 RepID=UPI001AD90719|nr:hypothetical protein [Roseibium denhamense]
MFAAAMAIAVPPAASAEISSTYTKINLDQCTVLEVPPEDEPGTFGGSWICEGYNGIPVYVAEGDLRMFVSFGPEAQNEPAAAQTLPSFNTVNDVLEWRLKDGIPFATILRWFPSLEDGSTGSVLIVTQYRPGGFTCQIAMIDARLNPHANGIAREAADQMGGKLMCSGPPLVLGDPGVLADQ